MLPPNDQITQILDRFCKKVKEYCITLFIVSNLPQSVSKTMGIGYITLPLLPFLQLLA